MDKCPMCGARLQQGLNYCEVCGADISTYQDVYNAVLNSYSYQTQQPQPSQYQQPPYPQYQQANSYQTETCPHCGAQIPKGTQYCPSCGKEIKKRHFW
ncbi:zinc-ribbon domain-containing protein [Sulfuracidifex tepidarius]|uniref:DZANK-type domain-containing protein n=1 Tax=Sulfuracidifex tepidarius TaxID=1294262 RepID=A0A510E0M0_9CREN|nr:zinc ribbon domain-containing protein [Sulfuracidifex tepidarius]BBG23274.1 hypothetical protein IC006_0558 [Sulfuracidifex tepidarius]BBG26026.1 hypothetical protein IC007_0531 [Sulfuracidifex tepidarius]